MDAPELPISSPSPTGDRVALLEVLRYPPIHELAKPSLRLAGVRIRSQTGFPHDETLFAGLSLLRIEDGVTARVELPDGVRVSDWKWSADGRHFAFHHEGEEAVELWLVEAETARARRLEGVRLNPMFGTAHAWMPDQRTLLVTLVPQNRGEAPRPPAAPPGPQIKESAQATGGSTYEARDVLTNSHDAALFEHYAGSQIALVDALDGSVRLVGEPGPIASVSASPDGKHLLVGTLHRPWSYQTAWWRFPCRYEVWDLDGKVIHQVADAPLRDQVPIHGVEEGPRQFSWRPTAPATLVWYEALDGGDPSRQAPFRDRVMTLAAPFQGKPREIHRAQHRVGYIWWGERRGLALVGEYERERRWRHAWAIDADNPGKKTARKIIDVSARDLYNDPGYPILHRRADGAEVMLQEGDAIYLSGGGASPKGDRPFLDLLSLKTGRTERLFRSPPDAYEQLVDVLDPSTRTLLTRRQSPTEVPNYQVRRVTTRLPSAPEGEAAWNSEVRALTALTDPTPQIRGITQRIVTYERADGTPLSMTVYLPPGYQEGTRLPTVLEAYPLEYSDPATAGQISGTEQKFLRLLGTSPLDFLLDGYAVLSDVAMPVIGDPDTAYDTFIEQLVASAEAAIDKAVELGITDPSRVGVMGHSHGGLMTATLLAHSDLFRAGIARSGAYNHTLRPFGFQSERRTLWQAKDNYIRLSPLLSADRINEPLLLIHGEADPNPGTRPFQSERLYEAVRGTGGTVRLVMLPCEEHGYRSREAVGHVIAEQIDWFGRHVKEAPARVEVLPGASGR